MTLVPIREIGKLGVNTDWSPLDLPVTAWTFGSNVRFMDNRIKRGPIFSKISNITTNTSPRFCHSYRLLNGTLAFLLLNQDGSIVKWVASTPAATPAETNISATGWTADTKRIPYTSEFMNEVIYVNRGDRVPWAMGTADSTFKALANWPSDWRCDALRSFEGVLVALNVTKGGIKYPNMVKTSEFSVYGTVPTTWVADTTNSATENIIADLNSPLVDGVTLRDRFILYASNETWVMEYRGDNLMFNYKRLFYDRGLIGQNCVAEYQSVHYVFGNDDIWSHDGYQHKSIAVGRVRDFIFQNLVRSESHQFFALNNPKLGEIIFYYVSNDPYCHFPVGGNRGYPGCNRAAVYNHIYDTWTFFDVPYVVGGYVGAVYTGLTYAEQETQAYDPVTATYNSLCDETARYLMTVGVGQTITGGTLSPAIRLFEDTSVASAIGTIDTLATAPVFLENKQMDMDDISKELRGYKVVNQMWPEGTFDAGAPAMTFTWGSSDASNVIPVYGSSMTFDGSAYSKLDFNAPGKYLSLKMTYSGVQSFSFSGFDIDYQVFGHR
jgi:hypothetical protein